MNSLDKAIQICGGLTALAEKIGSSTARVGNWRARGVPVEHCLSIENATHGEVTRKDLRPNDWQNIWPELASSPNPQRAAVTPRKPAKEVA